MSKQNYDCLNEIINYMTYKGKSCSSDVQKAVQQLSVDLIDYRDLSKKTTVRAPKNGEEFQIVEKRRVHYP